MHDVQSVKIPLIHARRDEDHVGSPIAIEVAGGSVVDVAGQAKRLASLKRLVGRLHGFGREPSAVEHVRLSTRLPDQQVFDAVAVVIAAELDLHAEALAGYRAADRREQRQTNDALRRADVG